MKETRTRRRSAGVLAAGLFISVLVGSPSTTVTAAAAGGGPSVPLPDVPSVNVTGQQMQPRGKDEASTRALSGDQPQSGAAAEGSGTQHATQLAPSSSWSVAAQSGTFTWSYPIDVPPSPGGLQPSLALSYSSSAVDGRTSATNNQPSWVGDGWDLDVGSIERTYGGCSEDKEGSNKGQNAGDLCWRSDNATASYPGGGGQLILGANGWRQRTDNGSRIEKLTGAANGAKDGEYWRITTVDGTQYLFGSRPAAKSTWTVPVYGDDTDEPCHGSTFATSVCTQAWKWNLDKVIDRYGNVIQYDYETETNSYGQNVKDTAASYIRGGWLTKAEYGLHTGLDVQPTGRVLFSTAERCVPGSTCVYEKKDNFPDVPLDERCVVATCKDHYSPTFWTTKRLSAITTQVRTGDDSYADVDRWDLDQQFPAPGDGDKAALWLKSITHTGLAGGSITLPSVAFEGAKLANRVYQSDNLSPIIRYRITGIVSESGGVISVNYAPPDCLAPPTNPESNTKRCFPVRWTKKDFAERTDYFNKYVVESVIQSDRLSSSTQQEIHYEYLDGAAWHYDQSEFTPADKKTWNEFRGFGRVVIRGGSEHDEAGPITRSEQRFYRGMNGDRLNKDGGTKTVSVTDSEGGVHADEDWLAGTEYETATYDGNSDTVLGKTITDPVWQGPTATRGAYNAYIVKPGTVREFAALDAGRGWRVTRTSTEYDDRGQVKKVDDAGDVAVATDDTCTRTTYLRNDSKWLLSLPSRVETVAVKCATIPTYPDDLISDVRTSFDGQPAATAPESGSVTRLEQRVGGTADAPAYKTVATSEYDAHGRVKVSKDALGRATTTTYVPETGGPVVKTIQTNALGHTTTTTLDPTRGQPVLVVDPNNRRTESAYDALGRLVETWLPNRVRNVNPPQTGNYRYSYLVRNDAPTAVTTSTLGPRGNYSTSTALYDGLLRQRQTQSPSPGGGRLLADTRYDSQGRQAKTTQGYFNDKPVDTELWVANDNEVPGLTTTEYDGAGRPAESIYRHGSEELWRTSTRYSGDWTSIDPPDGTTPTKTITDGRGRAIELRQYRGAAPTGDFDKTSYAYTPSGQLATMTDASGNKWEYRYNLRGQEVWRKDPDKGVTTTGYDDVGQVVSTTDARSQTIAYTYDALGRKTGDYVGSTSGTKTAAWTYDTLDNGSTVKGQLATATSYGPGGAAYKEAVLGYNALYKPVKTTLTVPESTVGAEGPLAGTYEASSTYNVDGSVASETYPEIGGLFKESVFHTYDDQARPLRTYGGPSGQTVEYALQTDYTKYGEQQRVQLGEGTKRVWLSSYYEDSTRRLNRTIVDAELPQPMQSDVHYTRDQSGRITSIADTPLEKPADVQCFKYDYLQRLTEAWTPGNGCENAPAKDQLAGGAPYWNSYTYDSTGNRKTETQHAGAVDRVSTSTYPAAGSTRPHAVGSVSITGGPTENYDYDASGNTTAKGAQTLAWDPQGRLSKVTEAGKSTEFLYDSEGTRLLRRDPVSTTLYLGNQELKLDRATGALTATRYYNHAGSAIAVRTTAGLSWLASDHHNTEQLAIDSQAQSVVQQRSLPFGAPRGTPADLPGEKGFIGGTQDASTGLTQIGARAYDPDTGRFLSVDKVADPGDPQQLNGYAYANNDPVSAADPTGLRMCDDPACTEYQAADGTCVCPSSPEYNGTNLLHPQNHSTKHDAVQTAAGERIARQARALGMKNVRLQFKVKVPQGAKKCADKTTWIQIPGCTTDGEADIVLTIEMCPAGPLSCYDQRYVWEVKALGQDRNYRAQKEAQWYADHLQDLSDPGHQIFAKPGWTIGGPYKDVAGFPKTNYWGTVNGAVTYGDEDQPKVKQHLKESQEIGTLEEFAETRDRWKSWRQELPCGCPAPPAPPQTEQKPNPVVRPIPVPIPIPIPIPFPIPLIR
ncbi:RHS repeat-associated core domain-containing protein [Kribbella sp. NPDC051620]|uniref:RHS repeat-associated core domain-containing protein n=1 Tax=Kribbella sp. NPDC051620 TaxID=3364120 RepID=UPI0037AC0F3F